MIHAATRSRDGKSIKLVQSFGGTDHVKGNKIVPSHHLFHLHSLERETTSTTTSNPTPVHSLDPCKPQ